MIIQKKLVVAWLLLATSGIALGQGAPRDNIIDGVLYPE